MSTPLLAAGAGALLAVAAVVYHPPVDAPVVDRFRPPAVAYGPGNRGLQYGTAPGATVRAAAPGVVVFAGRVGATLHVSVLHADGVRTTYSYLQSVGVHAGERVADGQALGTAGDHFHLGALAGDAYLDPALLFAPGGRHARHAHLVADDRER